MKTTVACPFCGQDWLVRVTLRRTQERMLLCPECDSTWPAGVQPTEENAVDLSVRLQSRGLDDADWAELDDGWPQTPEENQPASERDDDRQAADRHQPSAPLPMDDGTMRGACPRCRQGVVVLYEHVDAALPFQLCEECDATWPAGAPLERSTFADLTLMLEGQGYTADWARLRRMPVGDDP